MSLTAFEDLVCTFVKQDHDKCIEVNEESRTLVKQSEGHVADQNYAAIPESHNPHFWSRNIYPLVTNTLRELH